MTMMTIATIAAHAVETGTVRVVVRLGMTTTTSVLPGAVVGTIVNVMTKAAS